MPWKSFIKDYLSFTRAERFGTIFLCGCVLLTLIVRWTLPYRAKRHPSDTTAYEKEIALFRKSADSTLLAKKQLATPSLQPATLELFYFDPNRATDEEWGKLGLNGRQIRNIRNYQTKGGRFRRKEDVKKLYTIPATQYQLLEPYIRIAQNKPVKTEIYKVGAVREARLRAPKPEALKPQSIELNTADSSLLVQLPGIGPVLAARTIKYRNRIGGFSEVAQLGEVYGIQQELMERIGKQLSANSSLIRKIPVNTATFRDLISHPYLNEQQVRGILHYRKLQTRINDLDELVKNHILEHVAAEKMRPYLKFE